MVVKDIRVWSADFTMKGWPDHPAKLMLSVTILCLGIAIDRDVCFFSVSDVFVHFCSLLDDGL